LGGCAEEFFKKIISRLSRHKPFWDRHAMPHHHTFWLISQSQDPEKHWHVKKQLFLKFLVHSLSDNAKSRHHATSLGHFFDEQVDKISKVTGKGGSLYDPLTHTQQAMWPVSRIFTV
jgi:hypothetical protein